MKNALLILCLMFGIAQAKAQIIITGMLGEPAEIAPFAGTQVKTDAPITGGYEYIQLRATEDIDFSITPYSLIAGSISGGSATANGWIAGGALTYKFNLTSGTVSKGEFFYVGNTQKVIAGPGSTAISSANWIRTKNTGAEAGDDGIGNASTAGFLAGAANTAGGIGVFVGTAITATTVPVDAIFFGANVGNAYVTSSGNGYLIPKNDIYDPAPNQPKFGMGTNTTLIAPKLEYDKNEFYKFGGVYNADTKTWTTGRTLTKLTLLKNSQLSDIESGTGVTTLPILLASFTGQKYNNGIVLNWKTASETNNAYFEILRSSDAKNFDKIGQISGAGKSNILLSYSFTDNSPLEGVNYYNLRQVDLDGETAIHNIISVNYGVAQKNFDAYITDNVLNVNLVADNAGPATLQLNDLSGKQLLNIKLNLQKGLNASSYSISSLRNGIYVASLSLAGNTSALKVVK